MRLFWATAAAVLLIGGVAAVAFIRDATIDMKAVRGNLMQIVRISVVAGFNGTGWQRASGTVQYAVMESQGIAI